jgi:hypothetical protein
MAGSTRLNRVITGTISGEVRIWNLEEASRGGNVNTHPARITQVGKFGRDAISGSEDGRKLRSKYESKLASDDKVRDRLIAMTRQR